MQAYHGDPAIKQRYLARVQLHRMADELVHGFYWENGKGCAVGCTVETGDDPHERYEAELGIPAVLAYLEDSFFENMPKAKAKEWPEAFLSSIQVGADLSHVIDHFMVWLLIDEQDGVIRFIDRDKAVLQQVASLYQRRLAGYSPTKDEWDAAWAAAWDAHYEKMANKLLELLSQAPVEVAA